MRLADWLKITQTGRQFSEKADIHRNGFFSCVVAVAPWKYHESEEHPGQP